ncbi:MAG: thioredoxin domain-containing protein [Candidatus Peregrinibacteria bacterium]
MIFWIVVVLLILGSVFIVISSHLSPNGSSSGIPPVSDSDWVKGNPDASVIIIEYSDFECPACRSFYRIMEQIVSEFGNHILFVYRHFPLVQIHPNARLSAEAAEAAGRQGKFWEMYSMIFENQQRWADLPLDQSKNMFASYATSLGLDVTQFVKDIDSGEVKSRVQGELDDALSAGLDHTPTFILNGVIINNPRTLEDFRTLIRQEIEKNS